MFVTTITPRVSETDGAGHINNTTVPVWFEAGRHEIFRLFTPDFSFHNWKMVIVKMQVDYVRQIYYGRDAEVRTWIQKIGTKSLVIYEEIHQDGEVCAKGSSTYVNFNFDKQTSEPIPEHIREQLLRHLLPDIHQ